METRKENAVSVDLKTFRMENDLLQKELAEYLGLSPSFLCKVENGREKLPYEQYLKILNNDRGWETDSLVNGPTRNVHIHHGTENSCHHLGSHSQINYHGYNQEYVDQEVGRRVALKEQELEHSLKEIARLNNELAFLKAQNATLLDIIKGFSSAKTAKEVTTSQEND